MCIWVDFVNCRSLSIAVAVMLIVILVTASDFPAIPCTYSGQVVHMRVPLSQSSIVISICRVPTDPGRVWKIFGKFSGP